MDPTSASSSDDASWIILGEMRTEPADIAAALLAGPLFRRRWQYLLSAVALLVLFAATSPPSRWSQLLPFVAFTVLFQAYLFWRPRQLARRSVAGMADPVVHYRLTPTEANVKTAGSDVTFAWNRLTRFTETATAFVVWRGYALQLFPKRAFAPADVERLREVLRASIKTSPRASRWWLKPLLWFVLVTFFLVVWQLLHH